MMRFIVFSIIIYSIFIILGSIFWYFKYILKFVIKNVLEVEFLG